MGAGSGQPLGQPERVDVHKLPRRGVRQGDPVRVYDMAANTGWVSVGVDHDTAEFAVETLRRWWHATPLTEIPQLPPGAAGRGPGRFGGEWPA